MEVLSMRPVGGRPPRVIGGHGFVGGEHLVGAAARGTEAKVLQGRLHSHDGTLAMWMSDDMPHRREGIVFTKEGDD